MQKTMTGLAQRVSDVLGLNLADVDLVGQVAHLEFETTPSELNLIQTVQDSVYAVKLKYLQPAVGLLFEGLRVKGRPLKLQVEVNFYYNRGGMERCEAVLTKLAYYNIDGSVDYYNDYSMYLKARARDKYETAIRIRNA